MIDQVMLNERFASTALHHPIIFLSDFADYDKYGEAIQAGGAFSYDFDYSSDLKDEWGFAQKQVLLVPALRDAEEYSGDVPNKNALTMERRRSEDQSEGRPPEMRYLEASSMLHKWGATVNVLAFEHVSGLLTKPETAGRMLFDLFLKDKKTNYIIRGEAAYIQVLGYTRLNGKIRYHLFSTYVNSEIIVPGGQMNANGFEELSLIAPLVYWTEIGLNPRYKLMNRDEKPQMLHRIETYMRKLVDECTAKGIKRQYRMLRQGAWEIVYQNGKRERLYHLGNQLLDRNLLPASFGVIDDNYLMFAANGIGNIPADAPITRDEIDEMEKYLTMREWEEPMAPVYIMGAIYASILSGLLKWRPHLWINAPFATGKSAISDALVDLLGDDQACYFASGDKSTEAGIRRGTDGKAVLVIFEEAEGETTASLEHIILLARAASDGKPVKQTNKHTHEEDVFTCHCMFMMFSIGNSLRRAADMSRFVTLNLKKFSDTSANKKKLYATLDGVRQKFWNIQMGKRLHYDAYKNASRYLGVIELVKDALGGDRDAKNMAPLIAGYWLLKKGANMEYLDELIERVNKGLRIDKSWGISSADSDLDEFKGCILNVEIELEINGFRYKKPFLTWMMCVMQLPCALEDELALKRDLIVKKLAEKEVRLKSHKLSSQGWELMITISSPVFSKAFFESAIYNKIKTLVISLGGSYGKVIRISDYRTARGIVIPVRELMGYKVPLAEEEREVEEQLSQSQSENNKEGEENAV